MKNTGISYNFGLRKINQISCRCKDCSNNFFCNHGMVMLRDDLWLEVSDSVLDEICGWCIEKRLGRKIHDDDFKNILTPCNQFWKELQQTV